MRGDLGLSCEARLPLIRGIGWVLLLPLQRFYLRVVFSSDGSEMPALLEASDSINIGDARPFRSTFKVRIRFDMRFVVPFKNYKVSSSRRVSVSSCKLGEFLCLFVQRWSVMWLIRLPMRAGRSLQGLECIFCFSQGCLCKEANVLYHM